MINYYKEINFFEKFKTCNDQIAVLKRKVPTGFNLFFKKLYESPFSVFGAISKKNAKADIHKLLKSKIAKNILCDEYYRNWLVDMSNVCKIFCTFQGEESISFWLGSSRGCRRYHVDMVPYRLLVTYDGQGTEILPNEAADRNAFIKGKSNDEIVINKFATSFLDKWDIALFRGGKDGILHRTPESASSKSNSILMRLDGLSFFKEIENYK